MNTPHMLSREKRWEKYLANVSFAKRLLRDFTIKQLHHIRNGFAFRYINGSGYEIGAQGSPLFCKNATKVMYIDYLSKEDSSAKYNIPLHKCVEVDIICNAVALKNIAASSASFIIANHVLEHIPNTILAMQEWLRILRTGGILFLTLPYYSAHEFDFEKKPTDINHIIDDYTKDGEGEDIAAEHIHEHVRIIDSISPEKEHYQKRYQELRESNLHTHYHVFDRCNSIQLLEYIHKKNPIRVKNHFTPSGGFELLFIIEKLEDNHSDNLQIKSDVCFNTFLILKNILKFMLLQTTPK